MAAQQTLDLQKIKSRDEGALRQLFEVLHPYLRRISWMYCRDDLTADDLLQDALLYIYSNLDKAPTDDESRFLAWCRIVARNLSFEYLRKRTREETICDSFDAGSRVVQQSSPFQVERSWTKDEEAILLEVVSQLSKSDRELLESRLAGMPIGKIAEKRNVSRALVYRQYNRIVEQIRKRLLPNVGSAR